MAVNAAGYKYFRWTGWSAPQYYLKSKESYGILRKAFLSLPVLRGPVKDPPSQVAGGTQHELGSKGIGGER